MGRDSGLSGSGTQGRGDESRTAGGEKRGGGVEGGPPGRAEVTAVITSASIVLTELRVLLSALSHQQPWEVGPLITPPPPNPHSERGN